MLTLVYSYWFIASITALLQEPSSVAAGAFLLSRRTLLRSLQRYIPTLDHDGTTFREQCQPNHLIQSALLEKFGDDTEQLSIIRKPHLAFPGGGIFFYWQAGVVTYLRKQQYDLSGLSFTGASAGALTATLAATNVDFYKATELALNLSKQAGIWDRKTGLLGIWGPIIRTWLDELLPDDVMNLLDEDRLTLLVTPFPAITGKLLVSSFNCRSDLIDCNMASVHLPLFLDGSLTSTFRGEQYIDGSFLAQRVHHYSSTKNNSKTTIFVDYNMDPLYQSKGLVDFVKAVSPDTIWDMLQHGQDFAREMEYRGDFSAIPKL